MKEESFEKSLQKLEAIVEKLENEQLNLDEALKLFQTGLSYAKFCSKKLEEAEKKVELLLKEEGTEKIVEIDPDKMEIE